MVDLENIELHRKMLSMFAPDVLKDSVLESAQALEKSVGQLIEERRQMTDLVSIALQDLSDLFCETPPPAGVKAAVYTLIEIKKLTST